MFSVSNWTTPDNRTGYFKIEGTFGSLSVVLSSNNDGVEVHHTYNLSHVNGNIYSHVRDPAISYLDCFSLYDGGVRVVRYEGANYINNNDPYSPPANYTFSGPWDEVQLVNSRFRVWDHYTWTPFQRKVSSVNAIPSQQLSFFVKVTVPDDRVFPGAFNPEVITQSDLNSKLADPIALYEGESGNAYCIERVYKTDNNAYEAGGVVIPLSDRSTTWTETYSYEDFMTVSLSRSGSSSSPGKTISHTIRSNLTDFDDGSLDVGVLPYIYSYNDDSIPARFLNDYKSIESEFASNHYQPISRWNYGHGEDRGFSVSGGDDAAGGALYGTDNFASWGG